MPKPFCITDWHTRTYTRARHTHTRTQGPDEQRQHAHGNLPLVATTLHGAAGSPLCHQTVTSRFIRMWIRMGDKDPRELIRPV
jgi:hypothetical protein